MNAAFMNILILTGAGISADSGVATFRDTGGIWAKYDYREVATPEGFAANPALVHEFYNLRRQGLGTVRPNKGHEALARLERDVGQEGGTVTLVTQNVDDLHERAGSRNLIHMHGELAKIRCEHCGTVEHWHEYLSTETSCPACHNKQGLRPHIVWFGEMPMYMEAIYDALGEADLFVSVGTSGSVYPAAGFVAEAKQQGIPCVELNLEPSDNAYLFDETRYGRAEEIVPVWVDEKLRELG